eukprot:Platyproteum_vivax@DN4410_c0_g1_i3.p1
MAYQAYPPNSFAVSPTSFAVSPPSYSTSPASYSASPNTVPRNFLSQSSRSIAAPYQPSFYQHSYAIPSNASYLYPSAASFSPNSLQPSRSSFVAEPKDDEKKYLQSHKFVSYEDEEEEEQEEIDLIPDPPNASKKKCGCC